MKILSIEECTSEIVETDSDPYPTYRRHSANCWENLMGQSWEDVYMCGGLEAAYIDYKTKETPSIDCVYSKPLTSAMDNLLAYRLGEISRYVETIKKHDIGDLIDRGLILRRLLEESDFYIVTKRS